MYRTIDVDFCAGTANVNANNAENGFISKYVVSPSIVSISGPSIVCTSGASLVVTNAPGGSFSWSVTPSNLTSPSSGNGPAANIQALKGVRGQATITFNMTGTDDCGIPLPSSSSKSFWVGPPNGGISGPSVVYPQQNYFYEAATPTSVDGGLRTSGRFMVVYLME
jgi:hypothetical protein